MRAVCLIVLFFGTVSFWEESVVRALPQQPKLGREAVLDMLQKAGKESSDVNGGAALSEGGMIYIPKPTSTQKQQEKLTKALNGTISALSSKTSDQAHQLELKLLNVSRSIEDMKQLFSYSISEWKAFISRKLEAFDRKLDDLKASSSYDIRILGEKLNKSLDSKFEAFRNASVENNNNNGMWNGGKSIGGYQGARLIIF